MSTTIRTTVRITGSFDPDGLTKELSLTPTHTARAGDLRGGSPVARYSRDVWRLVVNDRQSRYIEEELDELLAVLRPLSDRFRNILRTMGADAEASFGVMVDDGQMPSISLSASQITQLAELGMSIDIDIVGT